MPVGIALLFIRRTGTIVLYRGDNKQVMSQPNTPFYSGISGLVLPVPKSLYPSEFQGKSRLSYYSFLFNSIEINSSFYKLPLISTVKKWVNEVPDNFRFTFKLSKAITHAKALAFNPTDLHQFMQTIAYADDNRGCILVQFPPSLKSDTIGEVEKLLNEIKAADHQHLWKLAVEFRNVSWYNEDVYSLLNRYNTSMVIHDLPATATPKINTEANFIYMRFHGPGGRYRGSYSEEFLYQQAKQINAWRKEGKAIYFYFNNTMGDAVKNLQSLNKLLTDI